MNSDAIREMRNFFLSYVSLRRGYHKEKEFNRTDALRVCLLKLSIEEAAFEGRLFTMNSSEREAAAILTNALAKIPEENSHLIERDRERFQSFSESVKAFEENLFESGDGIYAGCKDQAEKERIRKKFLASFKAVTSEENKHQKQEMLYVVKGMLIVEDELSRYSGAPREMRKRWLILNFPYFGDDPYDKGDSPDDKKKVKLRRNKNGYLGLDRSIRLQVTQKKYIGSFKFSGPNKKGESGERVHFFRERIPFLVFVSEYIRDMRRRRKKDSEKSGS